MVHMEECVAAQYSGGNDIFKYYRDKAQKQYAKYAKLVLPYGKDTGEIDKSTIESLSEAWKEAFGDPEDPEVVAQVEATEKLLRGE